MIHEVLRSFLKRDQWDAFRRSLGPNGIKQICGNAAVSIDGGGMKVPLPLAGDWFLLCVFGLETGPLKVPGWYMIYAGPKVVIWRQHGSPLPPEVIGDGDMFGFVIGLPNDVEIDMPSPLATGL